MISKKDVTRNRKKASILKNISEGNRTSSKSGSNSWTSDSGRSAKEDAGIITSITIIPSTQSKIIQVF